MDNDKEKFTLSNFKATHDALKHKLDKIQITKEKHGIYMQRKFKEQRQSNLKRTNDYFRDLNDIIDKLVNLYKMNPTDYHKGGPSFFYKNSRNNFYAEEENFTAALTGYTKKQFFEGFVDLAGTEKTSKYGLLDILEPDTCITVEDKEQIREQDKEELKRLQSQYSLSERKRINSAMSHSKYLKAVEVAEKQLNMIKSQDYDFSNDQFGEMIENLKSDSKLLMANLNKIYECQLLQLLKDLESLNSTIILKGNYDLKIARQDYFLSKQNELINQLLKQFSRGYFVSILYEMEIKEHTSTYHLMFTLKSLLAKEIESTQKRINFLSDPLFLPHSSNKEIIRSSDSFTNRIFKAIVPHTSEKELYRSYNDLVCSANNLSEYYAMVKRENESVEANRHCNFRSLKMSENLNLKAEKSSEELSSIIAEIQETLSIAELQLHDEINGLVSKRNNTFDMMKRTIFPDFFNDPARLKRKYADLMSRVNALTVSNP